MIFIAIVAVGVLPNIFKIGIKNHEFFTKQKVFNYVAMGVEGFLAMMTGLSLFLIYARFSCCYQAPLTLKPESLDTLTEEEL